MEQQTVRETLGIVSVHLSISKSALWVYFHSCSLPGRDQPTARQGGPQLEVLLQLPCPCPSLPHTWGRLCLQCHLVRVPQVWTRCMLPSAFLSFQEIFDLPCQASLSAPLIWGGVGMQGAACGDRAWGCGRERWRYGHAECRCGFRVLLSSLGSSPHSPSLSGWPSSSSKGISDPTPMGLSVHRPSLSSMNVVTYTLAG